MDGVDAGARAGVAAGGAAGRGGRLSRGVADLVSRTAAAALEGVVQADPVTNLMGDSLTRASVSLSD